MPSNTEASLVSFDSEQLPQGREVRPQIVSVGRQQKLKLVLVELILAAIKPAQLRI